VCGTLAREWYVNTTPTPDTYWECQSGTWVNVGAAGDTYSTKNQFELKNSQWTVFRGNFIENGFYPTFGSQRAASMLFNQVDTAELAAVVRQVLIVDNRIVKTPLVLQPDESEPGTTTETITFWYTTTSGTTLPRSPTAVTPRIAWCRLAGKTHFGVAQHGHHG